MIRPFGERSLLVELDGWQAAQALARSIAVDPIAGVEATVPGLGSLLVELGPEGLARVDELEHELGARVEHAGRAAVGGGRARTIPVVYDGADVESAAEACGLAPAELAARHAATEVRVQFCGFAPGFAYLGDLPPEIRVPRLTTPRTRTPAGSVAIAGPMTGVYPADLPGGWRVIGRTPLLLFDPERDPPAYLLPGDTVRWRPIEAAEWPPPTRAEDW